MKLASRLAPLAVLVAAFAIPTVTLPAIASAQAQKIASADVSKVFSDIKETKDLDAKLKQRGQQLNQQNTDIQQRLGQLKQSRDQFKPGTDTYDRANQELSRQFVQSQIEFQVAQQDALREQKRQTKMIFDKIVATVNVVAKEKGYTMVVAQVVPAEPSDDQMDQMKPEALIQLLRQQNLLYIDPSIDLTAEVVTRMDAKYAAGGGGGASSGGASGGGATGGAASGGGAPAPRR
jgi:Skp family chaperone for outer membrane proteins